MSNTFRHHERYPVKPTRKSQRWFDGELANFRKEERASLSDLIDAASMAEWAELRDYTHKAK